MTTDTSTQQTTRGMRRFFRFAGIAFFVCSLLAYGSWWFVFDIESPLNRESACECVYEWSRLSPIPSTATDVAISTEGSMFTRAFTVEFDAPGKEINSWLQQSAGTKDLSPIPTKDGGREYNISPGGGAAHAEVSISADGTHVRIYTYWS